MELFRGLTGAENNDVEDKALVDELVKTGKFSDEEARKYIQKFNREGQIFERRPGILGQGVSAFLKSPACL